MGIQWKNSPSPHNKAYEPTEAEHIANILTHALCVVPSAWASISLVHHASGGTYQQYWSALVYGCALVLLFTVSTFFHCVFYLGRSSALKDLLHRGDRAMIYVFIASSSFPWLCLRPLPTGCLAAELHWGVWILASLGILYQQWFHERFKWLETTFYMLVSLVPCLHLFEMEDPSGVLELKLGGAVYILGVVFFKADGIIPCAHAIWHVHVGLGATFHYYATSRYLYALS